jgi:hypothetical protein
LIFVFFIAGTGVPPSHVWSCASISTTSAKGQCGQETTQWWFRVCI